MTITGTTNDLRAVIDLVLEALEVHDPFMKSHAEGVSSMATAAAKNMGWNPDMR